MTRPLLAFLLGCMCAAAMSAAVARDVQHLSAADSANCPADLAAAKADAVDKQDEATVPGTSKPATAPVRSQPSVRGSDATATGNRLQAPRWHSFLPGMFR